MTNTTRQHYENAFRNVRIHQNRELPSIVAGGHESDYLRKKALSRDVSAEMNLVAFNHYANRRSPNRDRRIHTIVTRHYDRCKASGRTVRHSFVRQLIQDQNR